MNLVIFIIGVIVGLILYYVFGERKKPAGTFIIDLSDPMKDVFRIEMDVHPDDIYGKKQMTLKVKSIGAPDSSN